MRLDEAKKAIYEGVKPRGYRVAFERVEGRILAGDHFPERDEPPFKHEAEAWEWAEKFAKATKGRNVNLYVVDAETWVPVPDYVSRKIDNR